ncbi:DUF3238 domain-containing protein [uncultured Brevibacillus sp.]|uniref:DUF3238 domain-containing protein n=1 Tax=uncultured Brevibacillus sp. TaxID=169970 RepID=UPI002599EDDB|nr:DUF3238 domain-containing protein [uncultured Brevibacillus sp.]
MTLLIPLTSDTLLKAATVSYFYDKNYNEIGKRQSTVDLELDPVIKNQDEFRFDVYHESGIPYLQDILAPVPAIDYSYTAKLYREDASYSIKGWHNRAPAHEMYISIDGGKYETLFNHDLFSFYYLFDVCPKYKFNISN